MMNKKAEGTASRLVVVLLIFLSGIMVISGIVADMAGSYGRSDLPEFAAYEEYYDEMSTYTRGIADSQVESNTTGFFGWIEERYEDSMLRKGVQTTQAIKGTSKFYTKSIQQTFNMLDPLAINPIFKTFIIIMATFTIVILLVRVIMRYNHI